MSSAVAAARAGIRDIYDTYRADGADKAMGKFMAYAGLAEAPDPGASGRAADAPRWEPSPEQIARMRASTDLFLTHLIRPTTSYRPGIQALRSHSAASCTRSSLSRPDRPQRWWPGWWHPARSGSFWSFLSRTGRLLASWTSRAG